MLPFVGNDQTKIPSAVLVYKNGGLWVYELEPSTQGKSRVAMIVSHGAP